MEGWDSKTPPFTSKCKEPPSHVLTRERVEIVENSPPSRQNARQRTGGRDWGPLSCILMQGRCKGNPLHQTSCLPPPNLSSATFHQSHQRSVSLGIPQLFVELFPLSPNLSTYHLVLFSRHFASVSLQPFYCASLHCRPETSPASPPQYSSPFSPLWNSSCFSPPQDSSCFAILAA